MKDEATELINKGLSKLIDLIVVLKFLASYLDLELGEAREGSTNFENDAGHLSCYKMKKWKRARAWQWGLRSGLAV